MYIDNCFVKARLPPSHPPPPTPLPPACCSFGFASSWALPVRGAVTIVLNNF